MVDNQKVIFSMVGINKKFDTKQVIKDISLSFFYGAKIGILGLNGSGKSTLLKIIAGKETQFEGEMILSKGYSIGMLDQEPELDPGKTVKEIVEEGASEVKSLLDEFNKISEAFSDPDCDMDALLEKQASIQDKLDRVDGWNLDDRLNFALAALNCPPSDQLVSNLSGRERRRVALCRLLIQEPDILLLDEPTNHLDAQSVAWLEKHLSSYKGTVIAVTHDRYFLDNVAGWILELDRGHGIPWKGNYSSWLEQKQNRLATEEKTESKRQKSLQKELEWIRTQPKARHSKSKARISAYETEASRVYTSIPEDLQIFSPKGPRLGKQVIEVSNLSKKFDDKILFSDLSFSVVPGSIVGIIGPNGTGKTSLFKMITGSLTPDSGTISIGSTVKLGYMEQSRMSLDSEKTVWEVVSGGHDDILLGNISISSRAYLGRFNITGQDQQKKVRVLSGGERERVQLACLLKEDANVLLMDEPTNDLDINTLRALEDGILNFPGCVLVISHDRWFLDRICTNILALEADGSYRWFEGSYSEYEKDLIEKEGKDLRVKIKGQAKITKF